MSRIAIPLPLQGTKGKFNTKALQLTVLYYDINNTEETKKSLCWMHVDLCNRQGDNLSQVLIFLSCYDKKDSMWMESICDISYLKFNITLI